MNKVSPARRRILLLSGIITVFVITINTVDVATFLDAAMGLSWSSEIIEFLKRNSQGLLLLAAISLIVEFAGYQHSGEASRKIAAEVEEFQGAILTETMPPWFLKYGLKKLHFADSEATEIIESLYLSRPPLRRGRVDLRISRHSSSQYLLEYENIYKMSTQDFLFAYVRGASELRKVVKELPQVIETRLHLEDSTEISWPPTDEFINHQIRFESINSFSRRPVSLRAVSKSEKRKLCQKADIDVNGIYIYRGTVDSGADLQISIKQYQNDMLKHVWWMADRFIEVSSMRIGCMPIRSTMKDSLFVPYISNPKARVQSEEGLRGVWEVTEVGWLLPGQGFSLTWVE